MAILKPMITCILFTPETAIELCHTLLFALTEL